MIREVAVEHRGSDRDARRNPKATQATASAKSQHATISLEASGPANPARLAPASVDSKPDPFCFCESRGRAPDDIPWEESAMARITGLEKNRAPWHLRWFYGVMRKMFQKDLTPVKIQMRVPGIVWAGILMEMALGRKRLISLRYIQLAKVRVAARIGCPF